MAAQGGNSSTVSRAISFVVRPILVAWVIGAAILRGVGRGVARLLPQAPSLRRLGIVVAWGVGLLIGAHWLAMAAVVESARLTGPATGAGSADVGADGVSVVESQGARLDLTRRGRGYVALGHAAPITAVAMTGQDRPVLSADADGEVRITQPMRDLDQGRAETWARRWLWLPYGRPIELKLLGAAQQVDPLGLPPSLAGRRGKAARDCDQCPETIALSPGAVFLGSPWIEVGRSRYEGPRRLRAMRTPFAIGRYEVTIGEWNQCAAAQRCRLLTGPADRPAAGVSSADALGYLSWLSERSGKAYRLPSGLEWEYAARAGSTAPFPPGPFPNGRASLWWLGDSNVVRSRTLQAVGSRSPNRFGLYDMQGSVREWVACSGYFDTGTGDPACIDWPAKGGAWSAPATEARPAAKLDTDGAARADTGFRVAVTLSFVNPVESAAPTMDQTVVNRQPLDNAGWDIDVFWCASRGEAGRALATRVARDLGDRADRQSRLGGQRLGQIRLRPLLASAEATGVYPSRNAIHADAEEQPFASAVATAINSLGVASPFVVVPNSPPTSWYLSVFACGP